MSKDVVYTFYGRAYSLAPLFLQLYVLTFIYSGLGSNVLGYLLSGIGETRIVFEYTLMNFLLFLPIALVLSSLYHMTGLLIAILASSLISLVYGLFRANRKIGISLDFKGFLRICLNSALSAVPVLVTVYILHFNPAINLILNGAIFLFSYLTLLPLTKTVNQSDIDNIRLMFGKVKIMGPFIKPILRYETKLLSIIETS
jgi:O-antigen/teichoic acid export membrane protein